MSTRPLPTDLQILNAIYDLYYDEFADFKPGPGRRGSKALVPINCADIASDLGVDSDIVFGRLYYYLDRKYRFKDADDGSIVPLFELMAGDDRHVVHFPYLASVLATMREENKKYLIATVMAAVSLVISITAIIVSLMKAK